MKKHLFAAGIAVSALVTLPVYGDFKMIQNGIEVKGKQKPIQNQAPEKNPYGQYKLIESTGETMVAPQAPSKIKESTNDFPNQIKRTTSNQTVEHLTWQSQRIKAEIERLRADLAQVHAELAAAQQEADLPLERAVGINKTLDRLEQRVAEAGVAILRITFGASSTKFTPAEEVGAALIAAGNNASRVNIYGHADNSGSAARNQLMARARAVSVKQYMIKEGVTAGKIFAIPRGSSEPIADNATVEGRVKNRRVDIEFRH